VHGPEKRAIDTKMTNSIQISLEALDQEIQHLVEYCKSEKDAIEEELDYIGWDCKIFTQQVEAT
jgi:hypothetical protein